MKPDLFVSWLQLGSFFGCSKSNPEIPTTIKTMGVNITNIASYLRVLSIEIWGKTIHYFNGGGRLGVVSPHHHFSSRNLLVSPTLQPNFCKRWCLRKATTSAMLSNSGRCWQIGSMDSNRWLRIYTVTDFYVVFWKIRVLDGVKQQSQVNCPLCNFLVSGFALLSGLTALKEGIANL